MVKLILLAAGGVAVWAAAAIAWWPIAYISGAYLGTYGLDQTAVLAGLAISVPTAVIGLMAVRWHWNRAKGTRSVQGA